MTLRGLVVVWRSTGGARAVAEPAVAALGHRGEPTWHGDDQLAVVAIAREPDQDMVWIDERWAVVGDIRLDNHQEIISQLGLVSQTPVAIIIVQAWQRWGEDAPRYLRGDYAMVVVDRQHSQIWAWRDVFGVRPLVWTQLSDSGMALASEAQALLKINEVNTELDQRHQAAALVGLLGDRTTTTWQSVRRLAAAHLWSWSPGSAVTEHRYWQLSTPAATATNGRAAAHGLRARLQTAVERRLPVQGHVASMLSGGLDSSFITALVAQTGRSPHAISMVLGDQPGADEGYWQRQVVQRYQLAHHRVSVLAQAPDDNLSQIYAWLGVPSWGPIVGLRARCVEVVRRTGAASWFDGYEGDLIIGYGLGRFAEWWRRGPWTQAAITAWQLYRRGAVSHPRQALRLALAPILPAAVQKIWRRYRHQRSGPWPWTVIDPKVAEHWQLDAWFGETTLSWPSLLMDEAHERQATLRHGDLQQGLETIELLAARAGARSECPFFDRDVVDWCQSLPAAASMTAGWQRLVLRVAARGLLPAGVRLRNGKGVLGDPFTAAVQQRVQAEPSLRELPRQAQQLVSAQRWQASMGRLAAGSGDYIDAMDWWLVRAIAGSACK